MLHVCVIKLLLAYPPHTKGGGRDLTRSVEQAILHLLSYRSRNVCTTQGAQYAHCVSVCVCLCVRTSCEQIGVSAGNGAAIHGRFEQA